MLELRRNIGSLSKLAAISLGSIIMVLIDVLLAKIFPTVFLLSIFASVFIGAFLVGTFSRSHSLLLGLGIGLINIVVAIALYFCISPPVPISASVFPPALVSIFSGLAGGAAGTRMKAWFAITLSV
ncbi:TIGR04086 family membrane protein [Pulveribacter suum]|uniref:TIGR04086 family membrane protein n=1 Tax=Pulveribacter suum TaxID=2116657 RepID=UPI000D112827